MANYEQHKIPIISSINDIPEPPTETEGSNISHMHQQFNNLIDSIVTGTEETSAFVANEIQQLNNTVTASIQTKHDESIDFILSKVALLNDAINQNSIAISETVNKTYHDGVISGLQQQLDAVLTRVTALESEIQGDTTLYVFDTFTLNNGQTILTIPVTGSLVEILVDNASNQYNLYFSSDDFSFTQQFISSQVDGYLYDYSPYQPVAVAEGNQLIVNNSGQNDPLITKIRLKII